LAEFDRAVGSTEDLSKHGGKNSREFGKELDDILAKYF